MKTPMMKACIAGCLTLASPAVAMERFSHDAPGTSVAARDPDEALERAAEAGLPAASGHGKPMKGARSILRNDATLRAAFAWLDNK